MLSERQSKNGLGARFGFIQIAFLVFALGCSSVPPEVVELSYTVGSDIRAMQASYDALIANKFDSLREQRLRYLNEEWTPLFIEEWIEEGRLVGIAQGEVVWSEEQQDFTAPAPGREQKQLLDTVLLWSEAAVAEVQAKRAELIHPLDQDEMRVRQEIRAAFNRIADASAHVTAHLNSLREVRDVQSSMLERLGLGDEIDRINREIIGISERAAQALEEIRRQDERLN